MIRVSNLSVSYGQIRALRKVSIDVEDGSLVTVLGPNGAGKTTLLGTIAGIVSVDEGDVVLAGESIRGKQPEEISLQGIGLVPEGHRVFSTLTVEENLQIGGLASGEDGFRDRRDWIMDLFPILQERLGSSAGMLSGGEQQQLAIAQALLGSSRALLLDEPSAGLAPVIVDRVFSVLERLREAGITLLLVEQEAERAMAISDDVYVLRSGQVVLEGKPEDLSDEQLLEAYFGSVPSNLGRR